MRLLILGTGWMAEEHAKQFSRIEGVELVGAVDVDRARVDKFADSLRLSPTGSRRWKTRSHGASSTRWRT